MSNRRVDDRSSIRRAEREDQEFDPDVGSWLREDDELAELAGLTQFARAIRSAFGRPRLEPTERERLERTQRRVLQRLGFAAQPSAGSRAVHDAVLDAALRDFSGSTREQLQHFQLFAVRNLPTTRRRRQR
jgi:hypothetical protein